MAAQVDTEPSAITRPPTNRRPCNVFVSINGLSALDSLLLLEVLVGRVGDQAADEDNGVQANAKAGGLVVGLGRHGAGNGRLGLGVAGLDAKRRR